MLFVVVDVGSSFLKTALANSHSLQICNILRTPSIAPVPGQPGFVEIAPGPLVASVRSQIDQQLAYSSSRKQSVEGILITGQMGGLIFVDDNGRATSNYISWQDQRACQGDTPSFDQLAALVGSRAASVLGNEFRPGQTFPLLHHCQRMHELPATGVACGLPDFLVAALTESPPKIERTNATGLLSIESERIASALFHEVGLKDETFPPLTDFHERCGSYIGQSTTVPVYAATGDHQTALVGAMLQRGELSINVATGSQVSAFVDAGPTTVGAEQRRPFFEGSWFSTVTNIPAGRALDGVLALLTETSSRRPPTADDWKYFFDQAETVSSNNATADLGFFPGAVAMPGGFHGLTESTLNVAHIANACLRQLADQYFTLCQRLPVDLREGRIAFSGGLARRSEFLVELIADRFGMPFRMSTHPEDALLGLAILGRVINGQANNVCSAIDQARRLTGVNGEHT